MSAAQSRVVTSVMSLSRRWTYDWEREKRCKVTIIYAYAGSEYYTIL